MNNLTRAHIAGEQRIRQIVVSTATGIWQALPGYNERDVPEWLGAVLPVVNAGQRQSAALTDAYLARILRRDPMGIDLDRVTGPAVRNGTPPEEVYKRPFVTLWTALKAGKGFEAGSAAALARVGATAAMDVQLAARAAFDAIGEADEGIYGYERVANGGACEYCQMIDGAYVKSASAMALHNHCGCSLEPLTAPHPRAAKLPSGVAVHEHGELGPMLGSPEHNFDQL